MTRRADWETRLHAALDEWAARPFEYGRHDCARFAAACVKAQTGRDPMRGLRGKYRDERGARRLIAQLGGLDAFMDERFERTHPARARRGDVVMVDGSLGICIGAEALLVGAGGLVRHPRADWSAAWRV